MTSHIAGCEKIKSDGGDSGYYDLPSDAKTIQDLVEYRNMNLSVGEIFKSCYRLGMKEGNDELYDVRKILWYAQREFARLQRVQQQEK